MLRNENTCSLVYFVKFYVCETKSTKAHLSETEPTCDQSVCPISVQFFPSQLSSRQTGPFYHVVQQLSVSRGWPRDEHRPIICCRSELQQHWSWNSWIHRKQLVLSHLEHKTSFVFWVSHDYLTVWFPLQQVERSRMGLLHWCSGPELPLAPELNTGWRQPCISSHGSFSSRPCNVEFLHCNPLDLVAMTDVFPSVFFLLLY